MIVERVRSQALRLLTETKPLLRLPDEEAQDWTVQVNNQLTNIVLNSVISGQVQQQVNVNRLADELGKTPVPEAQRETFRATAKRAGIATAVRELVQWLLANNPLG